MTTIRIAASGGLSTDPSALAQPENLRVADNVLLHRPGIIQPRFGLGDTTGIASRSVDRRPIAIVPFDGDLVVQSLDGSTYSLERGSVATVYSSDVTPPDTAIRGVASFAEARGSLYMTTDDGIKKLAAIDDTSISMAGVQTEYTAIRATVTAVLTSSNANIERYALETDGAAAYRYCWMREDANDYVRRSAPSARFVVSAGTGSGGPWNVRFDRISIPDGLVAGDWIEVYRTENVTPYTGTPGREYYLATRYQLTSAQVSAGYITAGTVLDDTPDSMLGVSLYTNPSQGGITSANEVPPLANSIAWWGSVMWYGNTTSRRALDVALVSVADNSADGQRFRTGLVAGLFSGTFTSASAAVTGVSGALYGLKVGQYITDASNGPTEAGTKCQALSLVTTVTTAITINNALLAANDTIKVFGETFVWKASASADNEITIGANSAGSASNLADKLADWSFVEPVSVGASTGGTAIVTATEETAGHCVVATVTGTGQTAAYSLTMSKTATDSGTVNFTAVDFVTINGVDFYGSSGQVITVQDTYVGSSTSQYRCFFCDFSTGPDFDSRIANTMDSLAKCVNAYTIEQSASFGVYAYRDVSSGGGPWGGRENTGDEYITFVRSSPALGDFSFACTVRPGAFRPDAGTAGATTTTSTRARGRVHWSKPQEPEAVPTLNYTDVGGQHEDVLALVPLDGALLVFKDDGAYAIRGSAPNAWAVDAIDTSLRLIAPQAVCVLGGVCYAWTDRGVAAVTEAGARIISGPISDALRVFQQLLPADNTGTKRSFWMVAHKRLGLVIVGGGATAGASVTASWHVWHTSTQRWSRWPIASRCAVYDPAEDRVLHAPNVNGWSLLYERTADGEAAATSYVDASLEALAGATSPSVVDGVTYTSITVATADFGVNTPAAGDVIVDADDVAGRVASVSTAGADKILIVTGELTGEAFDWHQSYSASLSWQAQSLPGIGARWTEMHVHRADQSAYVSTYPMRVGALTDGTDVSSTLLDATVTPLSDITGEGDFRQVTRVGLPRAVVRAARFHPTIQIRTAGTYWLLYAIDLHLLPQSQRVAR
jgi:hypothetical protein